jgi:neutral ceramidase
MSTEDYRVGIARVEITPKTSIWMSGYASRLWPSKGSVHPLWAKALAIQDCRDSRVVVVTTDLIGLPREITDPVASRVRERHGLERSRIVFNATHAHAGPLVWPILNTMHPLGRSDKRVAIEYSRHLGEQLFSVIDRALSDLAPARLSFGFGTTDFAVNRRERTPDGVRTGINPAGSVDPRVPVLRIQSETGRLRALMFGYACHNTASASDSYWLNGDYAGFAQIELETRHPGATAMFLMLCGGDQNPNPRGSIEVAASLGRRLAAEVDRVANTELTSLCHPIQVAFETIPLNFAPHTRQMFEDESRSADPARVRRAKAMLAAYNERRPVRQVPYPIQALRFGPGFTLLALGGEVVVAYALRLEKEYPGDLVVAGYSNDLMSYIPSRRILREGGYEAVDSMVFYCQPGPYADDVEDRVLTGIRTVMGLVGLHSTSAQKEAEDADGPDGDL